LVITSTHSASFTQGENGDALTITVRNLGTVASSGTVTVTNTLPSELTATAFSGAGWTTSLAEITATRSDSLGGGSSYPPLTITVNVASNAPAIVTNSASISGGGETNFANDSWSDVIKINALVNPGPRIVTLEGWDVSGQGNL